MKLKEKLQEWENILYSVNAQTISLRWIGLGEVPSKKEIIELNEILGDLIKDIRKVNEEQKGK